jgi:hypothetical protein
MVYRNWHIDMAHMAQAGTCLEMACRTAVDLVSKLYHLLDTQLTHCGPMHLEQDHRVLLELDEAENQRSEGSVVS